MCTFDVHIWHIQVFSCFNLKPNEPRHEKTCLCCMRTTKEQISLRSLISTFVVRCLDSLLPLLAISEISRPKIVSSAEQASLSLNWCSRNAAQIWTLQLKTAHRFELECNHRCYNENYSEWWEIHRWIGSWAPISQGINSKNLKAGVVKNKNIYFRCLAFFSVENFKRSHLVAEPAFSFRAVFW